MALTSEIARQQQPVTAVQVRRTRKRKVLGSKAAYAYVAPFFVVFAAFSLYPWLAKLRFRGSGFLLAFTIGTMMVPTQMGIIPLYMLMAKWNLAGTWKPSSSPHWLPPSGYSSCVSTYPARYPMN
jgi:ABC-type glycerol-3-phosphate transport system permease component